MWVVVVLAGALFLLSGCATTETVKQAQGEGTKRIYDYSYKDVYSATLTAAKKQELNVVEVDQDKGQILLSHGVTLWSWGERIAVFFTKVSDTATELEIVSKPVLAPLNFPPDWANRLFIGIDQELRGVK